jgi:hypothetical protein
MKKQEIMEAVAIAAPSIHLETIWSFDEDARWDIDDPELDPEDFTPWQSEVRATCIHNGQFVTGHAYLGGTWEKYGDSPEKSNPDISGYFPQKAEEALSELQKQLANCDSARLYIQTTMALKALKA